MDAYQFIRTDFSDAADMDKLVKLQNAVYAGKHTFTNETFKYWYLDNPNGRVISFNAFCGEAMAAHYAVIPVEMEINGEVHKGALSMATVTHPNHRGKGLFKKLASMTYEYAASAGYDFVIGVANANSYPGFIKYFQFTDISMLDVLYGFSNKVKSNEGISFKMHWSDEALKWRLSKQIYSKDNKAVYGTKSVSIFKKAPLVKTFLGVVDSDKLSALNLPRTNKLLRPFNLYVGLGSNAKELGYKHVPSFIKHSPFHLIFKDLTGGKLPAVNKENIFFQLMDFDVA